MLNHSAGSALVRGDWQMPTNPRFSFGLALARTAFVAAAGFRYHSAVEDSRPGGGMGGGFLVFNWASHAMSHTCDVRVNSRIPRPRLMQLIRVFRIESAAAFYSRVSFEQ